MLSSSVVAGEEHHATATARGTPTGAKYKLTGEHFRCSPVNLLSESSLGSSRTQD